MTTIAIAPEALSATITKVLGDLARAVTVQHGEVTVEVSAANYLAAMKKLHTAPGCQFEQLMDLCGVDYSAYKDIGTDGLRYAVVSHLLSISLNQRVRVRTFCADDDFPTIDSVSEVWTGANWFEREAFDLYGIVFEGHSDLRRILTDYDFIGHPSAKIFRCRVTLKWLTTLSSGA